MKQRKYQNCPQETSEELAVPPVSLRLLMCKMERKTTSGFPTSQSYYKDQMK
jgi:hypothetical protein